MCEEEKVMNISLQFSFKSLYFCYSDVYDKLVTKGPSPITADCKQRELALAENKGVEIIG